MSTLPASWLEYIAEKEAEIKRAPNPIKRHQPKVTRMQSSRMRSAQTNSRNFVHSVYHDGDFNTNVSPEKDFTTDVGGTCEDRNAPIGQNTRYRRAEESNNRKK
jgi:hypothetical protein